MNKCYKNNKLVYKTDLHKTYVTLLDIFRHECIIACSFSNGLKHRT